VSVSLETLGYRPEDAAAFAALGDRTAVPGRVVLEHNHVYRVMTEDGEQLAEAAGRMKHLAEGRHELPAVGDFVAMRPDPVGGRGLIRAILPRRSFFARRAAGRETELQVVAANIDTVFIVFGLDNVVNPRSIDRYLVVARHSGTTPVIVLNKADMSDDLDEDVADARTAAGETEVVSVSARSGLGLDALERHLLPGRTVTLLGPSGVGKSTIVNSLVNRELLATGEVRDWDGRGRHTSVHRQLVIREQGGLIIDTPGMRELSLWETDSVAEAFVDIDALGETCRFRDCRHETEPGCAVKAAAEAGTLDPFRFESFRKLQAEQQVVEKLREERAIIENKRHGRIGAKAMRAFQKDKAKRIQ
jgi:ribosome biogenesis GTPase / thiamine phosphate phosphatase